MPEGSSTPEDDEVDVTDFEGLVAKGEVGGDVVVPEGEVISVIDGHEVRHLTDTSPLVAAVMGIGIDDPPFGEEV